MSSVCNWCKLPVGQRGTNLAGEPCPCSCHNDNDAVAAPTQNATPCPTCGGVEIYVINRNLTDAPCPDCQGGTVHEEVRDPGNGWDSNGDLW